MAFSDPRYLLFLGVAACIIFLIPAGRPRLIGMLALSALFALGFGVTALVLAVVVVLSYLGGLALRHALEGRGRTAMFVAILALTLSPLLFYKYWAPFVSTGNPILPVGISFYTFMAVGYLIEVYISRDEVEPSPLKLAAFLSFFPHLSAGPIGRAATFLPQLSNLGRFNYQLAVSGLRSILVGLFMKIVIADTLAPQVNRVFSEPRSFGAFDHLLATVLFSFQVYADFAGYSLIAIGSAALLGIRLMKNFDLPYLSQTLPEYWRRWHISLSSWFRDYVFVPLQFKYRRGGKWTLVLALIATFTLVGIWHGAGLRYAVFGLIHGVLVAGSTLTLTWRNQFWRKRGVPTWLIGVPRVVATFLIVTATFVIFRAASIEDALHMYRSLLSFAPSERTVPLALLPACALLIAGDIAVSRGLTLAKLPTVVRWLVYQAIAFAVLGFALLHALQDSPYANQFIYFEF